MATDVSIRVGVDGEKEFRSALSGINSQIKNLNSEMKTVVSSMTGMDDAEERAAKQTDVLGRSIAATKQKISILSAEYDRQKAALAQMGDALSRTEQEFGKNSTQAVKAQNAYNRQAKAVNDLGTQLNNATADLNRMEKEMRDIESGADKAGGALDDLGDGADKAGGSLRDAFIGGAIAGGIQSLVSGISGLVDETTEYRKIMGTLEVSSQRAGYSAEQTATSYKQLYGVIGDDQQSATALANLQALGVSQDQLTQFVDGAIGAWATYGDSIPIDSLAEAINETVQAGTVTGTFADVLNWAGTSEDEFNEKLQATSDPAERANMVLQELANQGLMGAAEAWRENNSAMVESNEAQAEMNESLASIGETLSPVVSMLTEGLAAALQAIQPGIQFIVDNAPVIIAALAGIAAGIAAMNLGTIISMISSIGPAIAGMVAAIGGPVTVIVAAISGIAAAVVALWNTNEGFRNAVQGIWEAIKGFFVGAWQSIQAAWNAAQPYFQAIWNAIQAIFSAVQPYLSAAFSGAWSAIQSVWNTATGFFQAIWNSIAGIFSVVQSVLSGDFSGAWEAIKGIVSTWTGYFRDRWNDIRNVFSDAFNAFLDIGTQIVNGIKQGIANAWDALTGWVREKFQGLIDSAKSLFGINSPSRVFRDQIGLMIAEGLALGIEEGMPNAVGAAEGMAAAVTEASRTEVEAPAVGTLGADTFSGVVAALEDTEPILTEYLTAMLERANELIRSYFNQFRQAGLYLMQGVAQGVRDGRSGVINAIESALWAAVEAAKAAMEISSPSRVFAEIGGYMGDGIGVGFDKAMLDVNQNIAAAMMRPLDRIRKDDMLNAAAATVNGMSAVGTASAQTVIIPINLNGKQIAEVVFDPLKGIAKQRGVALG